MTRLWTWLVPMRPFRLREVSRLDLLMASPTRLPRALREHVTRQEFVDRLAVSGARIIYRSGE